MTKRSVSRYSGRRIELLALACVHGVVVSGMILVGAAKTREWPAILNLLNSQSAVDLNQVQSQDQLLPALSGISPVENRKRVAEWLFRDIGRLKPARVTHVGALARMTAEVGEIGQSEGPDSLHPRLDRSRTNTASYASGPGKPTLLTAGELREAKPFLIVRNRKEFLRSLALWGAVYVAGFWLIHGIWRRRRFTGDPLILPAIALLTGLGFLILTGLRDPFRDSELFAAFSQGVFLGCAVLLVSSQLDYQHLTSKYTFIPLLMSFGLSVLLLAFGRGPGSSDAKVNLGPFQPAEAIRVLFIFFLAGYFSRRWRLLRETRETRPFLKGFLRLFPIPKLDHLLPVLAGVTLALGFFFLQKDLGPVLLMTCVFLSMYGIARGGAGLVLFGLLLIAAGVGAGIKLGVPTTFVKRVEMMISPWNNPVSGGDQLAASLWALSSGGFAGAGVGMGEASYVPAAHTDLILSATGEETGFAGVAIVFLLFGLLVYRGMLVALNAPTVYLSCLTLGAILATGFEVLLITSGTVGAAPLSGVVVPFMSYGRSAMLANFALFGIVLAVSGRGQGPDVTRMLRRPACATFTVIGALGLAVAARAAYVQVWAADDFATRGAMVRQQDGEVRIERNPRLAGLARSLGRGSILDRNGLPLATSKYDDLLQHRSEFAGMGIDVERVSNRSDSRHYPLGGAAFHLLGDIRTRRNWDATNTEYVERAYQSHLLGLESVPAGANEGSDGMNRSLLRLWRHRFDRGSATTQRFLNQDRTVRLTIDGAFTARLSSILNVHLRRAGQSRGAVVVIDAASGEVLALVNAPSPSEPASLDDQPEGEVFDRARFGLYPPGSTFKLATAIAAIRSDAAAAGRLYSCVRLPGGRVGAIVRGSTVRDDVTDTEPHGRIGMQRAISESCNAYFAQLAVDEGAQTLLDTAGLLGIIVAKMGDPQRLLKFLPQAGYGQGEVLATPFQIARLAAAVANGGRIPFCHWIASPSPKAAPSVELLHASSAEFLGEAMRRAVLEGTGRAAANAALPIAGKTGTAEVASMPSHAWFMGFAPYNANARRKIAFSILVENGRYGGSVAAPIAVELVKAAHELGIL